MRLVSEFTKLCKIVNDKAVIGDHCFEVYREICVILLIVFLVGCHRCTRKSGVGENTYCIRSVTGGERPKEQSWVFLDEKSRIHIEFFKKLKTLWHVQRFGYLLLITYVYLIIPKQFRYQINHRKK